jgi:dolichol-phosphate mannosyltransferase
MPSKQKAVIISPTYNESENVKKLIPLIDEVIKKAHKKLPHWKIEMLIVDDTSPDKTYELVEKLQKNTNG